MVMNKTSDIAVTASPDDTIRYWNVKNFRNNS